LRAFDISSRASQRRPEQQLAALPIINQDGAPRNNLAASKLGRLKTGLNYANRLYAKTWCPVLAFLRRASSTGCENDICHNYFLHVFRIDAVILGMRVEWPKLWRDWLIRASIKSPTTAISLWVVTIVGHMIGQVIT
jgi:hypothetical protein